METSSFLIVIMQSNARLLTTKIRYKPDTKHILRKLNDLVRDLDLDTGKFFSSIGTTGMLRDSIAGEKTYLSFGVNR